MKKLILLFVGILIAGSTWGQTPVGTGQTYTTLKSAFDAINNGTLTGAVVLQLTSSTSETASAVLNASGGSSSYTSVAIYPTGSGYTIGGAVAGALIQLNGADAVTIDGRVNLTGAKDLIIQNTNTSNATIELKTDATGNFIQYCVIRGASTSTSNGIVLFSAGTSSGNDNNTIDHNDINANGSAMNCIYAAGSVGIIHNAVTISNNNIFDFRGAGSTGINLASYNSDWTIDGNSIYQTGAGYTGLSGTTYGIQVGSSGVGNGYLIQNNYIGGSSANGVGTWTINGTAAAFRFQGINLNVGTATASSIQNNTIKGFSWLSTSGASSVPGVWCGIYLSAGNANIGTVTGNTIGDASTGSVSVQINSTGGITAGIISAGTTANIAKNTISSFTLTGSTVSVSHGFNGIWVSAGTTTTIDNNTIGSTSVANSINCSNASTSTTTQSLSGILNASSGSIAITNNTIANLNNNYSHATTIGTNRGISITAGSSTVSVNNNNIYTISASQNVSGTGSSTNVVGIHIGTTNPSGVSVSGNFIYDLKSTATTSAANIAGIYYNGTTSGTNVIAKNVIHSLTLSTSSTSAAIYGISIGGGTTTFQNNMLRLGLDVSGANIATGYSIAGINDASGTNSFYFNSVYIGGSPASGSNTYAFNSTTTFNTRSFQNNIFVNARTNSAGTAKHYAFRVGGSGINPTGLTSNYNLVYANGTGGILGLYNSVDISTLKAWREATGQDLNSGYGDPNFVNPTGSITAGTFPLKIQGTTPAEASGNAVTGISDDIEGNTRSSLTPTDIGADAGNYTASDIFTPSFTYSTLGNTSGVINRTLSVSISDIGTGVPTTGTLVPRIWYRNFTTLSAWANTGGTFNTGNGNNGSWTFTIDYSLIGGAPAGNNVIQYYLVGQDQAGSPNIWYSPYIGASHANVNSQTSAPTTPNSYTIVTAFSGALSVGAGQTYTTLTGATAGTSLFAAINAGVVTGNMTVSIVSDISEPGTTALNQWTEEGGSNFTLTIQSDGTLRTLSNSANLSTPMISINGADRVTITGGTGAQRLLRFRNTHSTPGSGLSTIQFTNSTTGCTVNNCTIENNSTNTSSGNILITATGTNPVIIDRNDIRDATSGTIGQPKQLIFSPSGSTNVLTITNNNLFNWTGNGVQLTAVGDGCSVSGNSWYQTASQSSTFLLCLAVQTGNNHNISDNYIGGTQAQCGGTAFTCSGLVSFTGFNLAYASATASSVQNNTIQNLAFTNAGSYSVTLVSITGATNFGTITGNTIGHLTTANSITYSGTGSSNYGIYISSNQVENISNNIIGNITASGTGGLYGMYLSSTSGSNIFTVSNNTVCNLKSASTSATTGGPTNAMYLSGSSGANHIVSQNSVYGLENTSTGANSPRLVGMYCASSFQGIITANKIYGFIVSATNTGTPNMKGIALFQGSGTVTLSNNVISLGHGISNQLRIDGIWDASASSFTTNAYFNSVYLGGTASAGTGNSYCYIRDAVASTTTLKDNIFYNARTGGTGKQYAIANTYSTPATGWSATASDYNVLYGTAATIGLWSTDKTFATWQTSTTPSQDVNSPNSDPTYTSTTNLLPQSGSPAIGAGTAIAVTADITGATRSLTAPTIGAYEVVAGTLTWTGAVDNDWNKSTNWSPAGVPFTTTSVSIPNVANDPVVYQAVSTPAQCNNMTIQSGAVLTINAGKALTVNGTLTNTNNAGLVVKAGGSLIESTSGIHATVESDIAGGEWHLISSPLTSAVSGMFLGKYLQNHSESTNAYTDILTSIVALTPEKGFALYDAAGFTAQYAGTLNTGDQSYTTAYSGAGKGWNLAGNPYPSSIDWNASSGWTKTNLNASVYIHKDASTWATFNGSIGTNGGSRYIAPCQGFFVQASAAGTLGMTNSVKVHNAAPFYKNSDEVVNNMIRLEVSGNGYSDEAVVWFLPEATSEFDGGYDAHKLFGDVAEAAQLYTVGGELLAINSMPEASSVTVGMRAGAEGIYTIAANEINDISAVSLEDTKTGILTDLKNNAYSFSFIPGETETRFVLHFGPLSVNETENTVAGIYASHGVVYVDMKANAKGDIYIYNIAGQLVAKSSTSAGSNKISLGNTGNYIVKVISDKSSMVKKVFVQ